jgi:S-adenosylmethionine uptake transporter
MPFGERDINQMRFRVAELMRQAYGAAMHDKATLRPFLATLLGVALLSLMDVFMKNASLAVGAYSTLVFRHFVGIAITVPAYVASRPVRPDTRTLRLHALRGGAAAFTSLTFFSALVILPLAEAIALSFISPLVALALAALVLKEKIRRSAIWAALLGLAGVGVIIAGRVNGERMTDEAWMGIGLVLISALTYAWNLILQRQQALRAKPLEIAAFQSSTITLFLLPAAPWLLALPPADAWFDIAAAAVLGVAGGLVLAWSYARAEAQVLVPVEYSGFIWAVLFGWTMLGEPLRIATAAGAMLIIGGCWIAAPRRRPEQAAL